MIEKINEFLHYTKYERFLFLGKMMPFIAIVYSIIFLLYKKRMRYAIYFLAFIIINTVINNVLKATIQEERPQNSNYEPWLSIDNYGMPSGHAQTLGFITGFFLYKYPKQYGLFFLNVINSILTSLQRVYGNYHTERQALYGLLIGLCIGVVSASYM